MKSIFRTAFFCGCASLIFSCSINSVKPKEEPLARVYDKYLYKTDLAGVGSRAARPEDSIQAVRSYIDSWIRHNILLRYAEDNLPDEEKRLNDRLKNYKESLLIYAYEKELLSQKLDTSVSEDEIKKYFTAHNETFNLKNSIAKVKYIMLKSNEKVKLDSIRKWIKNTNDFNYPKLLGFCNQYAIRFSISDSVWYNKEELVAFFPVNRFNLDNAEFNKSYLEVLDSNYAFLINFVDFRIKGSDAPIDFVRNEITNIIVNQRKMAFIGSIHKSIYEEALKNSDFTNYIDEKAAN
ncbi:MAG: hypothetical protein LH473_09310 [Chitinophagales bacterium]|nr:hypothetical protein [Chitinophagales bacterium]